ncbi:hypothetical protein tb265_46020 [Gemmatimonadetes bacterium T265]|nr:hypothetical protein tb265_46020 [Gemmatimonadetes bacterium T265]
MTNTTRPSVRERDVERAAASAAPDPRVDSRVDPRVARTTGALADALVALLAEGRAFDAVTVQDILDRAGVGRTAFYAHYRNKHDVLFSSYEGLLAAFEGLVDRPSRYGAAGARLFPVAEFLEYVGDMRRLVDALGRDGLLEDAWAMLAGEAARVIARRLDAWAARAGAPAGAPAGALVLLPGLAPMLAGALVEGVRWWQARPDAATPADVDAAFHQLARGVLRRQPGP